MTDDPPASPPVAPLSVATDLTLTIEGVTADVTSTGERLFVDVSSVLDGLRVARALDGVSDGPLDRLAGLLTTADLAVELRVSGRTVAVLGADARPGPLSRSLGVTPAEVRVGGVLGAVFSDASDALASLRRALDSR